MTKKRQTAPPPLRGHSLDPGGSTEPLGPLRPGPLPQGEREDDELPAWVARFWAGLIVTGSVRAALEEAGVSFETAWAWREAYPLFASYWDRAVRLHKAVAAGLPFLDAVAAEEARSCRWSTSEVIALDRSEESW